MFFTIFKYVHKYLGNNIIDKFFYKKQLAVENRVYHRNTLCGSKICSGCVSDTAWCSSSQGLVGIDSCYVKDSKSAYIINWTRIVIFQRYFRSSSASSSFIASYDLQYS